WAVEPEEVADLARLQMLLEQEHEIALVERAIPGVPAHLLEPIVVLGAVETQHAGVVRVAGRRGGGLRPPFLRPVLDDVAFAGRERLAGVVFTLVATADPLCSSAGSGQRFAVRREELVVVLAWASFGLLGHGSVTLLD